MLAYLQSLPDLGARPQGAMRSADFTLARMQWLLDALGDPQQAYPSLHVAGTNGKGSVCTLAAAALLASGLRVGCFTSPHWRGAWQGIAVDGEPAQLGELKASFALLRPHLEQREGWTQFEVVTALAFQHFARIGAQVAVVEVGLGGSLDATNVITPSVAVITPIDYDHTSILGNSLAQIAAHKAGIIKPGVPLVLAPQVEEAGAVIRGVAREKKAPVTEVGVDVLFAECGHTLAGQDLAVWSAAAPQERTDLHISLLGQHQVVNAATAYAALQALRQAGVAIDQAATKRGFSAARWPGRFEVRPGEPPLVLDAAHSPQAALALRQALEDYFPDHKLVLVLGVSADKDLEGIIAPLRSRIEAVIATQSSHARAMPAVELKGRLADLGMRAEAEPIAVEAVQQAQAVAGNHSLVLVAGSVFLVEEVREGIRDR